ncbi:MAG: glycogen debranching protein GlgX [Capsulimonadaceae bacterium]
MPVSLQTRPEAERKVAPYSVDAAPEYVDPHEALDTPAIGPIEGYSIGAGSPHPLGAIPDAGGVNFSVFSEPATGIQLLLFNEHDDVDPIQIIDLDPNINKTFHFWHVYVKDLKPGIHYAYRVSGSQDTSGRGHRCNANKVLIDPYARGTTNNLWDRGSACGPADNIKTCLRGVVIDTAGYDWEGDKPLNRAMSETVIYETHVGGFTKSPTSNVKNPGTYSGLVEKIPYLQELGITAVELLPVFDFDEKEVLRLSPIDGKPLMNYWGYSTVSFFAPHSAFCVSPEEGKHLCEFRDMVKALHKAGIEVILDVVFNHTTEGNHQGPMINFKGFDNAVYYHLVQFDKQYYMDYSGCGNTVKANHPIAEKFIIDCLEYWVNEMHVDGFRFDEAVILCRDEQGQPTAHPPVIWNIELSETLARTKVIAEAWDAAGLYEIGFFPGYRWAEWNGKYRDAIRGFVKGDPGIISDVASRIAGSADIYQNNAQLPVNSINFVACHDGFCLNDMVSYNYKHNEANGEGNRDGIDNNVSWNCGWEGETTDQWILDLRKRQIKNFITLLMVSQGVPMFIAGDEVQRTQKGNNNAYCQDNELTWFDWSLVEKNQEMFRFFKNIIHYRRDHPALLRPRFFTGQVNARGLKDIDWHGTQLYAPEWNNPDARMLAFTLAGFEHDNDLHVMMNMFWYPARFEVPVVDGRVWKRFIDTALPMGQDIVDHERQHEAVEISGNYLVTARSIVLLSSREQ